MLTPQELDMVIDRVIAENKPFIEKQGKYAFGRLMGEVMQKARGKADGKVVSEKLKQKLNALPDYIIH